LPSCAPQAAATGKPVVLCSIFAYYDAARAIAGDKLDVQILLPPSSSPHEYETTPADKVAAYGAALYIKNDMGLDDQFDKLLTGSKAKILNVSAGIPKDLFLHTEEVSLDSASENHEHASHEHVADAGGSNPHIWLDPHVQIAAAKLIRDSLIQLDPADKAVFEQNTDKYVAGLEKLDRDFAAAAATFKTKDFIGFHSAYAYLARRYGLRQIAAIEEIPGTGLSPAAAVKIINLIKDNHIQYIAVETALPEASNKVIVRETGVKTIILQPLETYDEKTNTYEQLMRQNLDNLKIALGGQTDQKPAK
jgi:zinc transport system substrate-binding protein